MGENDDTTHRVKIDYVAEDHASETAKKIAEAYKAPAEAVEKLKDRFREFRQESLLTAAGTLGVGLGIGSLVEKARDVTKEFSSAQKAVGSTLATVLQWPAATGPVERFQRAMRLSADTTEDLDEKASDLGSNLGEMTQAYRTLAVAVAPLHVSQRELISLTEKSTALAMRFGESSTAVADQIGHALVTRVVRPMGDVGIFLSENLGRKLQGLNNAQVLDKFDKAMAGSVETARMMSDPITKIHNEINGIVRKVSAPLFKEIGHDVEKFYEHLHQAAGEGRTLMDVYGDRLLGAFREMKDVAGFIAEHWKSIALIWATAKAPKLFEGAAGIAGSIADLKNPLAGLAQLKNLFSQHGAGGVTAGTAAGGGIGNLLGVLGGATQGIAGLATASVLAAQALHGVYEEWQSRKKQAADLGGFFKDVGEVARTQRYVAKHGGDLSPDQLADAQASVSAHAQSAAKILQDKGLLDNGVIAMEKFNGVMDSMSDDVRKSFMAMLPGSPDSSSGLLGAYAAEVFRKSYQAPAAAVDAGNGDESRKTTGKTFNFYGPVNINQKFEDQEPDRVAVRLKDDLENYTNRRTQSALVGAGGF